MPEVFVKMQEDFQNLPIINLEQNFQSTGKTIDASNFIICQGQKNKGYVLCCDQIKSNIRQYFYLQMPVELKRRFTQAI